MTQATPAQGLPAPRIAGDGSFLIYQSTESDHQEQVPRNRHRVCTDPSRERKIASSTASRLTESIEQGPGEHERHQSTKHIARPEIPERLKEVGFRVAVCFERVDKPGHNSRANEVEDEAWKGLQSESTSGDTEERRGQSANVRDGLWQMHVSKMLGCIASDSRALVEDCSEMTLL